MSSLPKSNRTTSIARAARADKREVIDFWTNPFFNQHARTAFRGYAAFQMRQFQDEVMKRVAVCESPLEAAFWTWWLMFEANGSLPLTLIPQQEVIARGRRYRLDFVVQPKEGRTYSLLIGRDDAPKVAVELDGHHYHDKTKAQATKRNRRDRDLASEGWTVLHASYSEFHDDPMWTVVGIQEDADRVFHQSVKGWLLKA